MGASTKLVALVKIARIIKVNVFNPEKLRED